MGFSFTLTFLFSLTIQQTNRRDTFLSSAKSLSCNAICSLFKDFWNWFSVNPGASLLRGFHDILIGFLQYLGLFPLCDRWIINDCDWVFGPVFEFDLIKLQVLNALSTLKCNCDWIWTQYGSIQIVETPVQFALPSLQFYTGKLMVQFTEFYPLSDHW